jgi:hypothetical protein
MVVDSRAKGARAETIMRDQLRKLTGLKWERVPGSGALDEKHGLKGDLYVPNEKNLYAVEAKHYKDDHLSSQVLTSKSPQLLAWWSQAVRQGTQVSKKPVLIFKHDRSKTFVAYQDMPTANYRYVFVSVDNYEFYVATLEDYINFEKPKFIA